MNFRAILFVVLSFIILMVSVLMRPAPNVGIPVDDQAQVEQVVDADGATSLTDTQESGDAGNVAANTDTDPDDGQNDSPETNAADETESPEKTPEEKPQTKVAEKEADPADKEATTALDVDGANSAQTAPTATKAPKIVSKHLSSVLALVPCSPTNKLKT